MKYLSLCSGIEAASQAWHGLGWTPIAFSEIDPFCCDYLAHHYPDVPNLGNMENWRDWPLEELAEADVLVAGTPCQSFSIAGLRAGLNDERGNLTLIYVEIANAIDNIRRDNGLEPLWCLWENVPGVYSDRTNGFGSLLAGLVGGDAAIDPPRGRSWTRAGMVHGPERAAAWRTLDAQYFGVAQRRDRVFVLSRGGVGAWKCADALLPIRESSGRDSAPRREAREEIAGTLGGGSEARGWRGDLDSSGAYIPEVLHARQDPITEKNLSLPLEAKRPHAVWPAKVAATLDAAYGEKMGLEDQHALNGATLFVPDISTSLMARNQKGTDSNGVGGMQLVSQYVTGDTTHALTAEGFDVSEDGTGRGTPMVAAPLTSGAGSGARPAGRRKEDDDNLVYSVASAALHENQRSELRLQDVAPTLGQSGGKPGQGYPAALTQVGVRRLTPRECERLQGFTDDATLIPRANGRMAADGPRYRAIGNSMAVPVMKWIGERIEKIQGPT